MLSIPASPDPRVTKRYLVRQYEGMAPRIDQLDIGQEGFDVIPVPGNAKISHIDNLV